MIFDSYSSRSLNELFESFKMESFCELNKQQQQMNHNLIL